MYILGPSIPRVISLGVYYPSGFSYGDDLRSEMLNRITRTVPVKKICRQRMPDPDAVHTMLAFMRERGFDRGIELHWSVYAGCTCPCSPGYILKTRFMDDLGADAARLMALARSLFRRVQKKDRFSFFERREERVLQVCWPEVNGHRIRSEQIAYATVPPDDGTHPSSELRH